MYFILNILNYYSLVEETAFALIYEPWIYTAGIEGIRHKNSDLTLHNSIDEARTSIYFHIRIEHVKLSRFHSI